MTDGQPELTPFARPIAEWVVRLGSNGGFLVVLPDFRPELLVGIARAIGAEVVDFRATVMARHGAAAGRLPLSTIDHWLAGEGGGRHLVLANVEALLSTRSLDERRAWLADFVATPRPHAVVVPLVLFAAAAPENEPRVLRIEADAIPEETLLMRLWSSR